MPKIVIFTGPPGAGKNSVALLLAQKLERCAFVNVDVVRRMLIKPPVASWESSDSERQRRLGVRNASALTLNFVKDGADVLITDVLTPETARIYKHSLSEYETHIILLLPSFDEVQRRNEQSERLSEVELVQIYRLQSHFVEYTEKFDNTTTSADELAQTLYSIYWHER